MAAANQIAAQNGSLAAQGLGLLDELKIKFARFRLYRETINQLSALSNRELADLGLNRTMIKRLAYQAAYENA